MCMHTCKKVYELFILYECFRYSHLHFIFSKTEAWRDETPHLYICSSSSDPWGQCFAAASWGDWTTNVGSVLGLRPHGACVQHRLWWNRPCRTGMHSSFSVHDVTFINMDFSPVLLHNWDMDLGPSCPSPPWQEGRPSMEKYQRGEFWPQAHHLPTVTLDMSCYLPGPLIFLQQNEDFGSEGFKEVFLLL